jgi:hypothetical protein
MKRLIKYVALGIVASAIISCQKNELTELADDTLVSQQETNADEMLSDIEVIIEDAIVLSDSKLKSATIESSAYLTDCPVVTFKYEAKPQVMTIDFGTGCIGKDGKSRSGKIIVTSESFKTYPSNRTKTFENFYVENRKIEGNVAKTVVNDTVNHIRTAVVLENLTITLPEDEGVLLRSSNLTRKHYYNTVGDKTDNQIVSWGTVETARNANQTITKTISEENPLVFKVECREIVSGIAQFETSKNRTWTIDYGDGECDGVATLIRGEKTKEIKLR